MTSYTTKLLEARKEFIARWRKLPDIVVMSQKTYELALMGQEADIPIRGAGNRIVSYAKAPPPNMVANMYIHLWNDVAPGEAHVSCMENTDPFTRRFLDTNQVETVTLVGYPPGYRE